MGMFDDIPSAAGPKPSGSGGMFDDIPTAPATPGVPQSQSWSDVGSQALTNAPHSAVEFGKSIAQPFIHPVDTAKGLMNLGQGLVEYGNKVPGLGSAIAAVNPVLGAAHAASRVTDLIGGSSSPPEDHTKYVDAVGKFFTDRYGGMENLKKTMATDPVGFLADASAVLSGGGGLAARAPGIVGKIGEVAATTGRVADPLTVAGLTVKGVGRGLGLTEADVGQAALRDQGVLMTPGQMTGGYFKTAEDAISSIPLLGSWIKSGRAKSVKSFNEAVGNQALEPIGGKVTRGSAGHDMVGEVAQKLGDGYDALLPKLQFTPGKDYWTDLQTIANRDVSVLPETQQKQFLEIMRQRHGPPAPMDGQMFKNVEGELTKFAKQYGASADPAQRGLGEALDNVVTAMRDQLARSNPAHAAELSRLNQGWAMYARIRAAASGATNEGIFTPANLLSAIRSQDKSVGKGAFAKGDALMQGFAEAGQKVLPSKLPTSGTVERGLHAGLVLGGAHLLAHPELMVAGALAAAPYSRPGMRATNWLTGLSPPVREVGQTAFQAGRYPNPFANTP